MFKDENLHDSLPLILISLRNLNANGMTTRKPPRWFEPMLGKLVYGLSYTNMVIGCVCPIHAW
jgi:hypothetical protein